MHKGWIGFIPLRNEKGVIYAAKCEDCCSILHKRDQKYLLSHKKKHQKDDSGKISQINQPNLDKNKTIAEKPLNGQPQTNELTSAQIISFLESRKSKMHDGWKGFTPLRNEKGVIYAAKCDDCSSIHHKRDQKYLLSHKKKHLANDETPIDESKQNSLKQREILVEKSQNLIPQEKISTLDSDLLKIYSKLKMRNSKMHNGWDGFIPLRNEKGVIYAAKCEKCQSVYHKRDQETLSSHMKKHQETNLNQKTDIQQQNSNEMEASAEVPKKRSKMHDGWTGFIPLRNEKGVIYAAECNECGSIHHKRDQKTLLSHMKRHQKSESNQKDLIQNHEGAEKTEILTAVFHELSSTSNSQLVTIQNISNVEVGKRKLEIKFKDKTDQDRTTEIKVPVLKFKTPPKLILESTDFTQLKCNNKGSDSNPATDCHVQHIFSKKQVLTATQLDCKEKNQNACESTTKGDWKIKNTQKHNGWTGFIPLRNEKGVIYAAQCEKCNSIHHKRDQKTLLSHMKKHQENDLNPKIDTQGHQSLSESKILSVDSEQTHTESDSKLMEIENDLKLRNPRMHPGWVGFNPIRNEKGIIYAAECKECGSTLHKRDQKYLLSHMKKHRGNNPHEMTDVPEQENFCKMEVSAESSEDSHNQVSETPESSLIKNPRLHKGWAGFIPLRNEKGVICAAKCKKCNLIYHKRDQETLSSHMKRHQEYNSHLETVIQEKQSFDETETLEEVPKKKSSKMHDGWTGFIPLRNEKSVIYAAECKECGSILHKRDQKTLLSHMKKHQSDDSNTNTAVPEQNNLNEKIILPEISNDCKQKNSDSQQVEGTNFETLALEAECDVEETIQVNIPVIKFIWQPEVDLETVDSTQVQCTTEESVTDQIIGIEETHDFAENEVLIRNPENIHEICPTNDSETVEKKSALGLQVFSSRMHKGWTGFNPLRNEKGVIYAAKCEKCDLILHKRDQKTLVTHMKKHVDKDSNQVTEILEQQSFDETEIMEEMSVGCQQDISLTPNLELTTVQRAPTIEVKSNSFEELELEDEEKETKIPSVYLKSFCDALESDKTGEIHQRSNLSTEVLAKKSANYEQKISDPLISKDLETEESLKSRKRKLHEGWDGFIPLRNEKGVIYAAQCEKCDSIHHKRDKKTLLSHMEKHQDQSDQSISNDQIQNVHGDEVIDENFINSDPQISFDPSNSEAATTPNSPKAKKRKIEPCGLKNKIEKEKITELNVLLLKFLLRHGLDLDKVDFTDLKNFCETLDSSYMIPTPEELKNILPKLLSNTTLENL